MQNNNDKKKTVFPLEYLKLLPEKEKNTLLITVSKLSVMTCVIHIFKCDCASVDPRHYILRRILIFEK